ncbi:ABC transporter permease [Acetivibrio cellulolyticus]|uniref:ABC transporter permease n=1 Tax=Acetivibrio cellulolyticus TaxID=35830 RepID=UPI0001E30188|nr:ABC transporter permease [Acetivibrio cellulolyticus]
MQIYRAVKTVLKNRIAVTALVFLGVVSVVSIIGPLLSEYNYYAQDLNNSFLPPFRGKHFFGTDNFGRDLFIRVCEGAKISLTIGIAAAMIQTFIGVLYGCTAGITGGIVDEVLMRVVDMIHSIPNLIIVILLTVFMGRSEMTIIIALSITDWTAMARVMRGQTLLLREMEFVQGAKVLGIGRFQIILRHIIPNCMGPIIVNLMLSIPAAIFSEAFLSFLGLGIEVPKASWGTLASEGFVYVSSYPWMIIVPLSFIAVTMISFYMLGDAIKDALDSIA